MRHLNASVKPTILCVDDTPANLSLLSGLLKEQYRVKVATHGAKAIALVEAECPDLILLDVMMPEMDGFEVCRRLKENPISKKVPIIFLTAKTQVEDEELGLSLGAVDFIHKPISPPIVLARVKNHLAIKQWQDFLTHRNSWLEAEVTKRLSDINRMQDASIFVMVSLAEFRDECTGNHIRRTQKYVQLLAEALQTIPEYASYLTSERISLIVKSAPLHDIGKIAIPDEVLLKPGKLTHEEFSIMKTHTIKGFDMLVRAESMMGEQGDFLQMAQQIARSHHEKWDGSGYPDGLIANNIPLSARIMAVADVYDALMSSRPYKKGMSHEQASQLLLDGKGSHFDPILVDVFLEQAQKLQQIRAEWDD
jgi:putative two-component system response regulator